MDALAQSYTPEQIDMYKKLLIMFPEPPKIFIFYTPPSNEYLDERFAVGSDIQRKRTSEDKIVAREERKQARSLEKAEKARIIREKRMSKYQKMINDAEAYRVKWDL